MSARKQESNGDAAACIVEMTLFSVLASLGLNTYPREKGAERERRARAFSFDFPFAFF